jgi:phospholipid/cholesterol/gamma-HCH transport system substrate-binding protein
MSRNIIETAMGAVVLLVAGVFLFFAYSSTDAGRVDGYSLTARFDRIGSLKVGSDVRLSGVKIGTVLESTLDPETYLAVVSFSVKSGLALPEDTSAEIVSEGLLGGQFLALVPGGSPDMLEAGGEIQFTQSAVSLEQLLGKFIFNATESNGAGKSGS